jgi:VWFA-related protein
MKYHRPAGVLVGLAAVRMLAQQEVRVSSWNYVPPATTLRVESKLVEVGVVVRDRQGRSIGGLTQNDFKILDDGKERTIAAFSVDTTRATQALASKEGRSSPSPATEATPQDVAKPARYLALVFDDVHIKDGDLNHVRVAARRFVQEALQPEDRVGIFTTSKGQVLEFTSDVLKLLDVIEKLSSHLRMSENGLMPCPRITPYQAYLIVMQDPAAFEAATSEAANCMGFARGDDPRRSVRVQAEQTWDQAKTISQNTLDSLERIVDRLSQMPGNRVLVLASSGFVAETLDHEQNRIIDRALRANIVINAMDAKGLYSESAVRTPEQMHGLVALPQRTMLFEASRKGQELQTVISPIAYMAQSTGGLFFHDSNDLAQGLQELGAVPEVSYRLAFRPDDASDKRYHKLAVKLATKGSYIVQARPGYVAAALPPSQPAENRHAIDRELTSLETLANISARVTAESGSSKEGKPLVWVLVHVDLKGLPFLKQNDRHGERITFLTGLLDAQDNLVTAKEGRMDLDLTEATFARLSATGINAKIPLEAPAGAYRLRTIVEEGVEGKQSASSQPVEIK